MTKNLNPYTRPSFPRQVFQWWVLFARVYSINWQVFPWQVLFARVYSINWQVFPWQGPCSKACHANVLTRKIVRACLRRRQGKRDNDSLQGKPVQPYEQIKLVKENLREKTWSLYTRASKPTKNLSWKTCRVYGAFKQLVFPIAYIIKHWILSAMFKKISTTQHLFCLIFVNLIKVLLYTLDD